MKYGLMLALGLLIAQIRAQVVEEERNASALFGGGAVGESHPNVDLPKQVIAPEGKLTLYADYEHAGDDGIPLYLVNRSENSVSFNSQDGDIYLKLEYQQPDGKWQRAQAHLSSWCGNSYGRRELSSGQHFTLFGYRSQKGIPARVRYACYGNVELISNVGVGNYLPDDVTAAMEDGIGMRGFPRVLSSHVTFSSEEESILTEDDSFRQEIAVASLELMRVLGGSFGHEKKAEAWLAGLRSKPAPNPHELAQMQEIQAILARPWSPEMDRERLVNYCVQALSQEPPKSPGFGDPSSLTFLLWEVLGNFSEQNLSGYASSKPISMVCWRPVLKLAAQKVMSAMGVEQDATMQVLAQAQLADECLPDAAFGPLLASENQELVKLAAQTLSRRAHWERLVELGWKLSSPSQLKVLSALLSGQSHDPSRGFDGYGGLRTPRPDSEEERYWQHCMSAYPSECAEVCYEVSSRNSLAMPNLPYLEEQLFVYLLALVDHDNVEYEVESGEQKARAVLTFLVPETDGRALLPDLESVREGRSGSDLIALLNRLLTHPGYITERRQNLSGGDRAAQETRRFVFRFEASKALERLGQSVPKDLVIERQVTPTAENSKSRSPNDDPFR